MKCAKSLTHKIAALTLFEFSSKVHFANFKSEIGIFGPKSSHSFKFRDKLITKSNSVALKLPLRYLSSMI